MIKESICEDMKNTNEVIKSQISDVSISYAIAAKNGPVQNNISDLKTIINEARHAEKSEQKDRQSRTSKIIFHGVAENKAENAESDKTLFEVIKATVTIKKSCKNWVFRADSKDRPIEVSLVNEKENSLVLRSPIGMSIYEDLTIAERAVLKEMGG